MLSASTVKSALSGHSWLGLMVGALMYLVCLSGVIVVFYPEIERWEEPYAEESASFDPQEVERAFNEYMASADVTEHMYLTFPSSAIPRVAVASENGGRFVNADGSLGGPSAHPWTHFLVDLHLYLTIPGSWGMVLVSTLGAILVALIVTGFLAHPGILRDAFAWRRGRTERISQVDVHNRLSVWGAPFHLMIAVTGAWFGLVLLVVAVVADTGPRSEEELSAAMFGDEPQLEQQSRHVAVARALTRLEEMAPEAEPMYMTLHRAGTPGQFMEFYSQHPQRLIYSENYRFDTNGEYLGRAGFLDGNAGRQAVYSIYRLHFGHFGGMPVKLLYAVLGLALTVVSVTGINIWLARRRHRDWINGAWPGFVWGVPAAVAASGVAVIVLSLPAAPVFWGVVLLATALGVRQRDPARTRWQWQLATGVTGALLLCGYAVRFAPHVLTPAALGAGSVLMLLSVVFVAAGVTAAARRARRGGPGEAIAASG